tara:strand:- start:29 stop:256 length:228 start_codon:yes stop_codon:yes gene_type:complete
MEQISRLIKEALELHIERNELLKDSIYAEFASSDERMMEELQEIYTKTLLKNMTDMLIDKGKGRFSNRTTKVGFK